jgi:uncharacterized protein
MKKYAIILCVISLFLTSCCDREKRVDKLTLLGDDYRLFQDTPVWELAKAVEDDSENKIRSIILENPKLIDYQEHRFGQTLLMMTINCAQYKTMKLLLELGADPNKHDTYRGDSPVMIASDKKWIYDDFSKYLKLLLEYGGNPNDKEDGVHKTENNTPLIMAVSSGSLEKVKLLVQSGAEINYVNETNNSAVSAALTQEKMDILLFLLENNADYLLNFGFKGQEPMNICERLRQNIHPLDSKIYYQKMQVVEFLRKQGCDYFKTPIPDYIAKRIKENYPKDWAEYLRRY